MVIKVGYRLGPILDAGESKDVKDMVLDVK